MRILHSIPGEPDKETTCERYEVISRDGTFENCTVEAYGDEDKVVREWQMRRLWEVSPEAEVLRICDVDGVEVSIPFMPAG